RSKRRAYAVRTVERPGISPAVLFHLIPTTVFLRLADIAADLPAYTERVATVALDDTPTVGPDGAPGPSQREAYVGLAEELTRAVREALARKSKRLLGAYIQALLAYPDACTRAETVVDKRHSTVVASAPALHEGAVFPKEQLLIDLACRDRLRGRRTLVFCTHTETRDITPRLRAVLEREGFRVAVLKAVVKAEAREDWIAARVAEGVEVLLCNPRLVATGLDLLAFPSVCWYQTDYSVYTMRQASRRSWRPGQTAEVEVTFLAYRGTLQERALGLVAAKVKAALIVEGELPDDGLAGLDADDHDQVVALAKRLVDPEASDDASLEAMFAETRALEAASEEVLDEAHRLAPEPLPNPAPSGKTPYPAAQASPGAAAATPVTIPTPRVAQLPLDFAATVPAGAPPGAPDASTLAVPPPIGRVVRFEDLAALARPRVRRRKDAPVGQLALFAS
ncbi:MAG: helicase-related protein, partial [Chloroflexia bacterium]